MDIIFQSGEFYGGDSSFWTNLINVVAAMLGAVISGLIAIWIFKKGLKEQAKREQDIKTKRYKELESHFFHLISFMDSAINQQVNEIARSSQALKNFGNKKLALRIVPALNTNEVNSISNEDLYKMFVSNRIGEADDKASDFLNIKNCFRHIDEIKIYFGNFNQTLFKRLEENRLKWNQNLKALMELYNKLCSRGHFK
ncbi:hypothetical protein QQ020_13120 [Fulvivirgaceae bacterium BMA12]|uniref:Uncharacterized protein n=1 Tax=Agaribacillus aureus TaxID=3051825 RepID=A0ABT8L703_9BACT|nr:hypothetical protein [Fulvivirgaceae bacterium BMA12]